jgi:hypothetical protein
MISGECREAAARVASEGIKARATASLTELKG